MKLIIDITDEEEYKTLSKMSEKEKANELSYYEKVIVNGVPITDDYISRTELLKCKSRTEVIGNDNQGNPVHLNYEYVGVDHIIDAPSLVSDKKGKWLEIPVEENILYNTGIKYICSVCGSGNCYGEPPYCMYCGARMEKGDKYASSH